jgi:hypothetical protein
VCNRNPPNRDFFEKPEKFLENRALCGPSLAAFAVQRNLPGEDYLPLGGFVDGVYLCPRESACDPPHRCDDPKHKATQRGLWPRKRP